MMDHYEPKHVRVAMVDQTTTPGQVLSSHSGDNRNIYTLVYLNSFELRKTESKTTTDDVEVSCRLTLVVPTGIVDQHSVIISERLDHLIGLDLILNDEDGPVLSEPQLRKRRDAGSSNRNRLQKQVSIGHPGLYELEVLEGPVRLNKNDFNRLNATCRLVLRDYDESVVLDTTEMHVLVNSNNNKINMLRFDEASNSVIRLESSFLIPPLSGLFLFLIF
jgi:hypothetical protein